ncbi:MAG TPA: hydantoinase/oxoprolinase family protein [Hyphomicrobiaceae bacterium]|nr:hydantoinase/oxoprolinase family protein [Hyphomicrobiaceae bacterium]
MMRVAFDIGGTFTDFVLEDVPAGRLAFHKVPTTPSDPAAAVLAGLDALCKDANLAPDQIGGILHATTVATNAILERKGPKTALITTAGFRDILIIGRQKRYDTYDMYLAKPVPLLRRRDIYEVAERTLADGSVEAPLDLAELERVLDRLETQDYASVAVCLLHAYARGEHERLIGERLAQRRPERAISLSSEVSPKFREYERASTVVANAYVKPIVNGYIRRLTGALAQKGIVSDLFIMQSNGGLVPPELACEMPIRIVESGPAAGVLLCGVIGAEEGLERVLTFDMGGTTAKLGAIDGGEPAISPTFEVDQVRYRRGSGLPINVPALELLEIGAGGGSMARADMGLIKVGPESAGADPGPACYRRGGTQATVTDANVVLGYINPGNFNGGAMRLDAEAAAEAVQRELGAPLGLDTGEAAWGIYTMANANMERAMRIVSVERGRDPRRYGLVAFGGAGPLHAGRLARALGIPKIIVPWGAGVGSAIGLLEANTKLDQSLTHLIALRAGAEAEIAEIYRALEARINADLRRLASTLPPVMARFAFLRYLGQGHEIRVDLPAFPSGENYITELVARFEAAYLAKYGYRQAGAAVEAVDWYLVATIPNGAAVADRARGWRGEGGGEARQGARKAYFPELGGYVDTPVFERRALGVGEVVSGPAIIEEAEATTVVLPKAQAVVSGRGHLVIDVG